jgi:hypothetical protein
MGYDYYVTYSLDAKVSKEEFDAIKAKYLTRKLSDKDKGYIGDCDMTTNDNEKDHSVYGEEEMRWVENVQEGWKFLAEVTNGEIYISGSDDDDRSMMVFKDGNFTSKLGHLIYGLVIDEVLKEFGHEMPSKLRKEYIAWVNKRKLLKDV